MRKRNVPVVIWLLLILSVLCSTNLFGESSSQNKQPDGNAFDCDPLESPVPFPLQIEMSVPFQPTAFLGSGRQHLFYELYLTNFMSSPVLLNRLAVCDADSMKTSRIAVFEDKQLEGMFQSIGSNKPEGTAESLSVGSGQTAVLFVEVTFDRGAPVPLHLVHRIGTGSGSLGGATIRTRQPALRVLGAPLRGEGWLADDGPSNAVDNHHRRSIHILDGRAVISERYAIDWEKTKEGLKFAGDASDVHAYHSYGQSVFAVAEGRIVAARDGLPDNTTGHNEAFHPAVPITLNTVTGNTITVDLGEGQYAFYFHLAPGSLLVKEGDHVRKGQIIARVGCSGDAREPHLHFEVTNSLKALYGEGLPYQLDRFGEEIVGGRVTTRIKELPLGGTVIDFNEAASE